VRLPHKQVCRENNHRTKCLTNLNRNSIYLVTCSLSFYRIRRYVGSQDVFRPCLLRAYRAPRINQHELPAFSSASGVMRLVFCQCSRCQRISACPCKLQLAQYISFRKPCQGVLHGSWALAAVYVVAIIDLIWRYAVHFALHLAHGGADVVPVVASLQASPVWKCLARSLAFRGP
jgi:hypothetical protein